MLFNSIDFAIFLPIVFLIYWFLVNKNLKLQNLFILVASYVFYGWWDWRFLFLILISTLQDYWVALAMGNTGEEKKRKILLWVSMITNLGFLGFFKYYNFFIDQFVDLFTFFGYSFHPKALRIVLPVGISFYTFQTMSYTIDVYKRKVKPAKDLIAFGAYVAFFPLLVAGPIERATHLLPQFFKKRTFEYPYAVDGLRQMLWGFFKKMAIADNCAICVDHIFDNYTTLPASTLLLGAFFFSVQIYCDFSGYSDIAIGCSRLFGFNAMRNFAYPYFSRDIAEFWRRWHISLTTWFRDYVYIPLGGSRVSKAKVIRNTFIVYLVSGFWHGANWTFIVWGLINAIYFLPLLLGGKNRKYLDVIAHDRAFPNLKELWQMGSTFTLAMFAWIFFRAESVAQAIAYIKGLFSKSLFAFPTDGFYCGSFILVLVPLMFAMEWIGRRDQYAIEAVGLSWKRGWRWLFYYAIVVLCFWFSSGEEQQFIYFQF
jgi:Predicted membrane protein involved in D-alanine export